MIPALSIDAAANARERGRGHRHDYALACFRATIDTMV